MQVSGTIKTHPPGVTNHSLQFTSRHSCALHSVLETCMQVLVLVSSTSF